MTWLAGIDGCPAGWFRACRETESGELRFDLLCDVRALTEADPRPEVVALDMPVGLAESGPRACDTLARAHLGPRRSSVFPAPVRAALAARSHAEASALHEAADGRRVSAQAWNLFARIRAVDDWLAVDADARQRVVEVHPELAFATWAGEAVGGPGAEGTPRPMAHGKRTAEGRAERLALVEAWLGAGVLERARGDHRRRDLADDDILDALACLHTAHRIAEGRALSLPEPPPVDARGLPMRIVG